MQVKLTPAVPADNPKNTLRVKLEFMHGDADGYTNETFNIQNVPMNEELITKIIKGIEIGLDWISEDSGCQAPFIMNDNDWNNTNIDEETGIPIVGAKLHFVNEIQHKYYTERKIKLGTVVEANEDIIIIESDGVKYVIENGDDVIAPEIAIPVIVDGYDCKFTIDGIKVQFNGQSDHTTDNQYPAYGSIDGMVYFDATGSMYNISNY